MPNGRPAQLPGNSSSAAVLPLTERILGSLPGPRLVWLLLWASWLLIILLIARRVAPGFLAVIFQKEQTILASGIGTAYTMLVVLWGTARLGRAAAALGPTVVRLTQGAMNAGDPFRAVGSVWGPLALMFTVTLVYAGVGFVQSPSAALAAVIGFVGWLPLLTFAWVAGAVLLGLHRLGGSALHLLPFEVDRSLGLRPFGSLAFIPLLVYAAAIIPQLLIGAGDIRNAVISLGMLVTILVLLFASLRRLRGQLLAAKGHHMSWARELYAQALRPVRGEDGLAALRAGALELVAAEAVERKAAAIQEWPFDEGILRAIVALVTSVTTAILARLILNRLNF
ncbi:MAG: hypothetical protein ACRDGM_12105 [bacterium]